MIYLVIVLIIIIIILSIYLFLLHKELNKLPIKINKIKKLDSNKLINSEFNLKQTKYLINEINNLLIDSRNIKTNYNHKNKKLNKMITNITHDLRTPLTSAIGYIDIIKKSNISEEERKQKITIVEERLKRLEELISSFFEFSKIISSNEGPKINKVDIVGTIEDCIALFYDDFFKDNRIIDFKCKKNKIYIYSNEMMLKTIFDNLLINALKHDKGNLKIYLKESDDVEIFFENDLDYDIDILKVFDEFYSKDVSRTSGNTGLGLVIVKDFVERLNGEVMASKEKNRFRITIKLKK